MRGCKRGDSVAMLVLELILGLLKTAVLVLLLVGIYRSVRDADWPWVVVLSLTFLYFAADVATGRIVDAIEEKR